jgi:hypothetical protein
VSKHWQESIVQWCNCSYHLWFRSYWLQNIKKLDFAHIPAGVARYCGRTVCTQS